MDNHRKPKAEEKCERKEIMVPGSGRLIMEKEILAESGFFDHQQGDDPTEKRWYFGLLGSRQTSNVVLLGDHDSRLS